MNWIMKKKKSAMVLFVATAMMLLFSATSFGYSVGGTYTDWFTIMLQGNASPGLYVEFSGMSASFPDNVGIGQTFTIFSKITKLVSGDPYGSLLNFHGLVELSFWGNNANVSVLDQYYDYGMGAYVTTCRLNSIDTGNFFYSNVRFYMWNGTSWDGVMWGKYEIANATARINAIPPNNPPVASGKVVTINEDTGTGWVGLNCSDPDGHPLRMVIGNSSLPGNFGTNGATAYYFTPSPNWNGTAWFDFYVYDPSGATSGWKTEYIVVNPVNDLPEIGSFTKSTNEDTPITFPLSDFSAHFSDVDGDAISKIRITSLPSKGKFTLYGNNITLNQEIPASNISGIKFTPDLNSFGRTSFGWNAYDGQAYATYPATCTISINGLPTLTDRNLPVAFLGKPYDFQKTWFTESYSDPEGESLKHILITEIPQMGELKVNGAVLRNGDSVTVENLDRIKYVTLSTSIVSPNPKQLKFVWKAYDGKGYSKNSSTFKFSLFDGNPNVN